MSLRLRWCPLRVCKPSTYCVLRSVDHGIVIVPVATTDTCRHLWRSEIVVDAVHKGTCQTALAALDLGIATCQSRFKGVARAQVESTVLFFIVKTRVFVAVHLWVGGVVP